MQVAMESVASARALIRPPNMDMLPSLLLLLAPPRMMMGGAAPSITDDVFDDVVSFGSFVATLTLAPLDDLGLLAAAADDDPPPPPPRTIVAMYLAKS